MTIKKMIRVLEEFDIKDKVILPEQILDLEQRAQLIDNSLGVERLTYANGLFAKIDLTFLGMKHPTNVYELEHKDVYDGVKKFKIIPPRFAVYNIDSPICKLDVTVSYREINEKRYGLSQGKISVVNLKSDLPRVFNSNLSDSFYITGKTYLQGDNGSETSFSFISCFQGIVPEQAKRSIIQARKLFADEIYLVAEAENWCSKSVPIKDPLVIGLIEDECFLVDYFDCTTMEDYVRREFKE